MPDTFTEGVPPRADEPEPCPDHRKEAPFDRGALEAHFPRGRDDEAASPATRGQRKVRMAHGPVRWRERHEDAVANTVAVDVAAKARPRVSLPGRVDRTRRRR